MYDNLIEINAMEVLKNHVSDVIRFNTEKTLAAQNAISRMCRAAYEIPVTGCMHSFCGRITGTVFQNQRIDDYIVWLMERCTRQFP